jgi:hypothetical protein
LVDVNDACLHDHAMTTLGLYQGLYAVFCHVVAVLFVFGSVGGTGQR